MPRLSRFVLAALPVMMVVPLPAQGVPVCQGIPAGSPAASSIVIVSFSSAVLETAEAQRDLGALQKKYSPRQQQLEKLNDDIEASKKLLGDSTAKLSEVERSRRLQDLNGKEKQLERDAEDFKNDSQTDSQQAFQRVAQKMYAFLQEYAQQHGYSAVIERGSDAAPVVWFAKNTVDITAQLTTAYNARPGAAVPDLPEKPAASRPRGTNLKKP